MNPYLLIGQSHFIQKKIIQILENKFKGFIPDNISANCVVKNMYGIGLAHFSEPNKIQEGISIYKERINRFNNLMQSSSTKYFIYVNEDYLYRQPNREESFDKNIFDEMLELERYLKVSYSHFLFKILYFDFMNHIVPQDSDIVPILLKSTKLWDSPNESPYPLFRKHVGMIMVKIFHSEFDFFLNTNDLFYR